jgi:hypothetical protein
MSGSWHARTDTFKFEGIYSVCRILTVQNFSMIFSFFRYSWIEVVEWHKKKYVSNFKKIFKKVRIQSHFSRIFENNGIVEFLIKYDFFNWNILFLMQLGDLYPTITKKEKTSCWNFGVRVSYIHCKYLKIRMFRPVHVKDRSSFKFRSLAVRPLTDLNTSNLFYLQHKDLHCKWLYVDTKPDKLNCLKNVARFLPSLKFLDLALANYWYELGCLFSLKALLVFTPLLHNFCTFFVHQQRTGAHKVELLVYSEVDAEFYGESLDNKT